MISVIIIIGKAPYFIQWIQVRQKLMVVMIYLSSLLFFAVSSARGQHEINLPYNENGWTEEEAAAHLLNRVAYGSMPGQTTEVAENIDAWIKQQFLTAPAEEFEQELIGKYSIAELTVEEIGQTYPAPGVRLIFGGIQRKAGTSGTMENRSYAMQSQNKTDSSRTMGSQNDLYQRIVNAEEISGDQARFAKFAEKRFGWKDFSDLFYQMMAQKLERAIYNPNQLEEVMVDFWFNHFNVSIHGVNQQAAMVYAYERDAIRPHALGNFRDLLGATAKHPAMLLYLDNNRSNADASRKTLTEKKSEYQALQEKALKRNPSLKQFAQQSGLNENYARELLELHTLGVEGGYSQKDVEEVARAFTGWKVSPLIYPVGTEIEEKLRRGLRQIPKAHLNDGFFFDSSRHDAEEKEVLGKILPVGGGMEEGEYILDVLAAHPQTAYFISKKLAQRFVADLPPALLVDKMASSFIQNNGDIKEVLRTMLSSDEFWEKQHLAAKIKTPLEVVASAVRAVGAEATDYRALIQWCTRMGQSLYAYQAPTGYPDDAAFWTNGAALVNRMNFANELATADLSGIEIDLLSLNNHHEPESKAEALDIYLNHLLPGRNIQETYDLLLPILVEPSGEGMSMLDEEAYGLEKVVALILGSPEFQRQ